MEIINASYNQETKRTDKELSEEEINYIVNNAVASNSFEGLITPPEEVAELKELMSRDSSYEEYKNRILEECRSFGKAN